MMPGIIRCSDRHFDTIKTILFGCKYIHAPDKGECNKLLRALNRGNIKEAEEHAHAFAQHNEIDFEKYTLGHKGFLFTFITPDGIYTLQKLYNERIITIIRGWPTEEAFHCFLDVVHDVTLEWQAEPHGVVRTLRGRELQNELTSSLTV